MKYWCNYLRFKLGWSSAQFLPGQYRIFRGCPGLNWKFYSVSRNFFKNFRSLTKISQFFSKIYLVTLLIVFQKTDIEWSGTRLTWWWKSSRSELEVDGWMKSSRLEVKQTLKSTSTSGAGFSGTGTVRYGLGVPLVRYRYYQWNFFNGTPVPYQWYTYTVKYQYRRNRPLISIIRFMSSIFRGLSIEVRPTLTHFFS
jgi:hypothetical protein